MDKKRIKILMVAHCFLPDSVGGTELYTFHMAKSLMGKGFDVSVFTAFENMAEKRYSVIRTEFEGIRVIKIVNSQSYARSFEDYFMNPQVDMIFRQVLKEEMPDLVHFQHLIYLSGNLPEVASQMGVRSVFTLHDYWYMCYRGQLVRPGLGICPGPSDGIFCASCLDVTAPAPEVLPKNSLIKSILEMPGMQRMRRSLKEKLSSEVRGRLKLLLFKQQAVHSADVGDIQNPPITRILEHQFRLNFFRRQLAYPVRLLSPSLHVKRRFEHAGFREVQHLPLGFHTTEKITGLPFDRKLKIAFLGNLIVNKGAAVILRELPAIARSGRIEIHIHGRPYDMLYVEELKKLSLQFPEDTVFFHGGYRSDRELKEILSNVHLVVFPSIWEENYPLVVRESLLLGVPVIGSKLGGVPEAVEDSVNGFLFDPYREGDLAEKISRILDNPGILSVITEGAKKTRIESMEGHLDKIVKVYEEALGCS